MIEFEIIQKINIKPITEETMRKLVLVEIQKQVPEAYINSVEFVTKRNPNRVELHVDAQYGKPEPVVATPRGGIEQASPDALKEPQVETKTGLGNKLMENVAAAKKDPEDVLIEEVLEKTTEPKKTTLDNIASMFDV